MREWIASKLSGSSVIIIVGSGLIGLVMCYGIVVKLFGKFAAFIGLFFSRRTYFGSLDRTD